MDEEERLAEEIGFFADVPKDEGTFHVVSVLPKEAEEKAESKSEDAPEESTAEEADDDEYSYQIQPTVTIKPKDIVAITNQILEKHLSEKEYVSADMKEEVVKISVAIRDRVRKMGFDRYRIVCQVTIGEQCDHDVAMTFLCLWKHEFDHYAIATFDGKTFFATALVFLVYKQ